MNSPIHKINKDKFLAEMQNRGWRLDEHTHSWIRPGARTQREAEQNWVDAILASIDCPHETQLSAATTTQVPFPKSTSETLKNA